MITTLTTMIWTMTAMTITTERFGCFWLYLQLLLFSLPPLSRSLALTFNLVKNISNLSIDGVFFSTSFLRFAWKDFWHASILSDFMCDHYAHSPTRDNREKNSFHCVIACALLTDFLSFMDILVCQFVNIFLFFLVLSILAFFSSIYTMRPSIFCT